MKKDNIFYCYNGGILGQFLSLIILLQKIIIDEKRNGHAKDILRMILEEKRRDMNSQIANF